MFLTAAPLLFVHGVTAEEWTARYGVQVFSHPCSACGRVLTTTTPFAQGTIRGLLAPGCACGHMATPYGGPYALVRDPKHGDLFDGCDPAPRRRPRRRPPLRG